MISLGKMPDKNIKITWLSLDNGWSGRAALYRARGKNFSKTDWADCLSQPNLLFENIEKILKIGTQNWVAVKNLTIRDTQLKVVIKHHYPGAGWRQFFRSFRPGKALRNFKTALKLVHCGIAVTAPFAALHQRRNLLTKQSIYITEYFGNSSDLHSFASKRLLSTEPAAQFPLKRHLSHQLAAILASLHRNGLWHRDSKASNFTVIPAHAARNTEQRYRILLTDMDGIKRYLLPRRSRQFRSLWQLAASLMSVSVISRTDYLRTFIAYCNLTGLEPSQRRPLFRRLAKRAQAKRLRTMATVVINK